VLIALDGENAWEHYPFNGYYFLKSLYSLLASHPLLELTTLSGCLARGVRPAPLPRIAAGSWVHGTLATWMGDPAKNRAWDLLCEAKEAYDRVLSAPALGAEQRALAGRQLAQCESSDWFWWFGDYNPAESVSQFDRLFRRRSRDQFRDNLCPYPLDQGPQNILPVPKPPVDRRRVGSRGLRDRPHGESFPAALGPQLSGSSQDASFKIGIWLPRHTLSPGSLSGRQRLLFTILLTMYT